MNIEKLRELRLAHPFKPFNLVLTNGRKLPVDKPYFLGISPTRAFIVHSSAGGGFERLPPEAVITVDFDDPVGERKRNRPSSNGDTE